MNPEQNKTQVLYILWGALLFSQCLFVYLTLNFLYVESVVGPDNTVMMVLPAMAFVMAIISFVVNRKAQEQKTLINFLFRLS